MTNLEIAKAARLKPITEIAAELGLSESEFEPMGRYQGKFTHSFIRSLDSRPSKAKFVLVTAMTPTPKGEGKTTTVIGLTQGLCRIGKKAISATREPALGPVFGVKGGACGGGYSQVLPMEQINLFFTGDFPAISSAHNLISAMLDAHILHGNKQGIDYRQFIWPRTVDMNDRALREILVGLGGKANGYIRADRFVITPASEIMAILCLSKDIADLKKRIGRVQVGVREDRSAVSVDDIGATGAATLLMKDAVRPNLVQTIEGGPALVHGGPFANIAHGCSSILASKTALALGDYVVTEAGFASDLGAEKFMDVKVPELGRAPDAIVLVVTARAIEHHGGGDLMAGIGNVERHISHLRHYGPQVLVAINRFKDDTDAELAELKTAIERFGVQAYVCNAWAEGGAGCTGLAEAVVEATANPVECKQLYDRDDSTEDKVAAIVKKAYGGDGVEWSADAKKDLNLIRKLGLGHLPVIMAKTQNSLSDDPKALGAPTGFKVRIREVQARAGAGFLVCIAGDMMLMPGLGADPAALHMDVDDDGNAVGLF